MLPLFRHYARHIPNALTSLRGILAFVFPFTAGSARWMVLVVALATEYLDGALSRRYHWETELGQLLDPIADKLFFVSFVGTNLIENRLDWTQILLLGSRDLIVLAGALLLMILRKFSSFRNLKPKPLGKLTTALQYAAFFDVLVTSGVNPWLLGVTSVTGTLAGAQYWIEFKKSAQKTEEKYARAA